MLLEVDEGESMLLEVNEGETMLLEVDGVNWSAVFFKAARSHSCN